MKLVNNQVRNLGPHRHLIWSALRVNRVGARVECQVEELLEDQVHLFVGAQIFYQIIEHLYEVR